MKVTNKQQGKYIGRPSHAQIYMRTVGEPRHRRSKNMKIKDEKGTEHRDVGESLGPSLL